MVIQQHSPLLQTGLRFSGNSAGDKTPAAATAETAETPKQADAVQLSRNTGKKSQQPSFSQNIRLAAGVALTSVIPIASGFLWIGGIPGIVLGSAMAMTSGAVGRRIMKGVDEEQLSGPLTSIKRLNDLISNPESIKERLVAEGKLPQEALNNPEALQAHHHQVMEVAVDEVLEGVLKLKIPYLTPFLGFALKGSRRDWLKRYMLMKMQRKSMDGKKAARIFAGANFNYEIANANSFPDAVKRGAKALWRSGKYIILWALPEAMIRASNGMSGPHKFVIRGAGHAMRWTILAMGLRDVKEGFSQNPANG